MRKRNDELRRSDLCSQAFAQVSYQRTTRLQATCLRLRRGRQQTTCIHVVGEGRYLNSRCNKCFVVVFVFMHLLAFLLLLFSCFSLLILFSSFFLSSFLLFCYCCCFCCLLIQFSSVVSIQIELTQTHKMGWGERETRLHLVEHSLALI